VSYVDEKNFGKISTKGETLNKTIFLTTKFDNSYTI